MTGQANFLQSLGWALLNSLWQLALLWVVYQLLTACFKSAKPAAKSLLASSLLLLGFSWFIFTFLVTFGTGEPVITLGQNNTDSDAGIGNWLPKFLPAASVIYLLLLTVPLLQFVKNYRYVQVIRKYGLSKPAPEWRIFVNTIAARLGIRKPVHIWLSEWVTSPVTIGFLKPVILIPLAAINHLDTPQMEAVLLHELSHIRRHDYLLNFILNIIRTILYFNPFARTFVKIVEAEREKSCDEMVLQFQYDSHRYASSLLTLEKLSREYELLVVPAAGGRKDLLHRVQTILGVAPKPVFSFRRFSARLMVLFCVVAFNTALVINESKKEGFPFSYKNLFPASLVKENTPVAGLPRQLASVINNIKSEADAKVDTGKPDEDQSGISEQPEKIINPEIISASFETMPDVILDKVEEAQVKEAIEASKKVVEGQQWKVIEQNLAEVFNQEEKESLKSAMKDEISKFDWNKWENKLRLAYDRVDWEKVNYQLADAINRMQTDSLVKVYSEAMVNLNQAQKELSSLSLKGIPDTDIILKVIADKQRHLQRTLNHLKATRIKKIVHL